MGPDHEGAGRRAGGPSVAKGDRQMPARVSAERAGADRRRGGSVARGDVVVSGMGIRPWAKSLALNYLPDRLLMVLKRMHYYRTIRSMAEEDEPDLLVVRHLVGPGDTVVDVGANVGLYTRFLASLVGRSGRIYS